MASPTSTAALGHNKSQVARNSLAGGLTLMLTMIVGVLYTPFTIRHLGVAVYGMVPLMSAITNYLTIVTVSVAGVAGRNITAELARGDIQKAGQQFHTFLRVSLIMAASMFALSIGFTLILPRLFSIPPGQERSTQGLFVAVAFAFLVSMVAVSFEASVWARNRLDLRSAVESTSLLMRTGLVVAIFLFVRPSLSAVGIAAVTSAIFSFFCYWAICRKLTPELWRAKAAIDPEVLRSIWATSRWLFLNQLSQLLLVNIDLVMINLLLGSDQVGFYAPVAQWLALLRSLVSVAITVLAPPVIAMFANRDFNRLTEVATRAVKILALAIALPVALLAGFSVPLLSAWVGPEFAPYAPLSWILLVPLVIEAAAAPLYQVVLAADRFRKMALTGIACGLMGILLVTLFVRVFHWGVFGVAAGVGLSNMVRHGFVSWYLVGDLIQARWRGVLGGPILAQVSFCLALAGLGTVMAKFFAVQTLPQVIFFGGIAGVAGLGLAWILLLNRGDRGELIDLARRLLPKF